MIELQCACGYRFGVSDEAAGLTTDCPHCGEELLVPAESDEAIPFDPRAAPPPRERTVLAEPVALPSPPALSPEEAERAVPLLLGLNLRDLTDAITQPQVTFGRDVCRSPSVLFAGANKHMAPILAVTDAFLLFTLCLIVTGINFVMAAGAALAFFPLAWHCSVFFRACEAACAGSDDVKLIVFDKGPWENLLKPFGRFVATWWLALMPLWLCLAVSTFTPWAGPSVPAWFVLLAVCLFLWPAAVVVVVLGDSVTALTPMNLFLAITGAFGTYLLVWGALAVVVALGVGAGWLAYHGMQQAAAGPLVGVYLVMLAVSATALLMMRIIGLMYRHFKAQLPFEAE